MGAKGRLKAVEYDWEHIAQRVMNYYLEVLGKSPMKEGFRETKVSLV